MTDTAEQTTTSDDATTAVEQAEANLAEAKRHRDALRDKAANGEKVTAKQLGDADDAIALAELHVDNARRRDAEAREQARQAEIDDLLRRFDANRKRAGEVAAAYDDAVNALQRLHDLTGEVDTELVTIARRLAKLGPLPDRVAVKATPLETSIDLDGARYNGGTKPTRMTVAAVVDALRRSGEPRTADRVASAGDTKHGYAIQEVRHLAKGDT